MAGKTRIGAGALGMSRAQAMGWKLLTDAINRDSRYEIFNDKGQPFYVDLVEYDDKVGLLDKLPSLGDFKPQGLDPLHIKNKGNKNLVETGMTAFNYTVNNPITTAPVEQGHLISVNKVKTPISGQVTYVSTGTEKQRAYFERALKKASSSLKTFYLSTPAGKVKRINITGYTSSQSSEGGGQMFKYLVSFSEVIDTAKITPLKNATYASGASQHTGQLEPQKASGSQKQAAGKKA